MTIEETLEAILDRKIEPIKAMIEARATREMSPASEPTDTEQLRTVRQYAEESPFSLSRLKKWIALREINGMLQSGAVVIKEQQYIHRVRFNEWYMGATESQLGTRVGLRQRKNG